MPFLSILLLALVILTLIDVITRDESQVRHMPRFVWLLLVVLLPLIGSILWFTIGREYPEGGVRLARERPSSRRAVSPATPRAPVRPADTRTTEEQLADLEREMEEWRLREEIAKRRQERDGEA